MGAWGYKHSIWGCPESQASKLDAKVQFFCSGQHSEVYLSIPRGLNTERLAPPLNLLTPGFEIWIARWTSLISGFVSRKSELTGAEESNARNDEQNGKGLEHLAFPLRKVKPAKLAHARSLGCSVLVNYFEPGRLEGKASSTNTAQELQRENVLTTQNMLPKG